MVTDWKALYLRIPQFIQQGMAISLRGAGSSGNFFTSILLTDVLM